MNSIRFDPAELWVAWMFWYQFAGVDEQMWGRTFEEWIVDTLDWFLTEITVNPDWVTEFPPIAWSNGV